MILPQNAEIIEVCPRDGFQNVKDFIPTERKIEIIKSLIDVGFKRIEATSFVNPQWVPQMADASEVVAEVKEYAKGKNVSIIALIPNEKGFANATKAGVDEVNYVVSVSETHNKKNVNRTVDESLAILEKIAENRGTTKIRLALATALGCPFGEKIETKKIIEMAKRGLKAGANEILVADTVGLGHPQLIEDVLTEMTAHIDASKLCMHLHDTRGLALANTIAALRLGVTKFESAVGGLGGCPFAPGAAGNVATEDLVNLLSVMNVETGLDQDKLSAAVDLVRRYVNSPIVSHMSKLCHRADNNGK